MMSTDLKLALTTTAADLLMIIAFSFTAILH
ncbi:MAG: YnhF family membrane protein [Pantoea sp. Pent]|nr:YnhF family membrane protein [Pantoea sp. Pent]